MLWILWSILIVIFGCVLLDRMMKDEEFDKIPGPKGMFLFENAFDFLGDSVEIFQYLSDLSKKYKEYLKLKIGPKKLVVLLNPEDVETLISSTKFNSKGFLYDFLRPWLNDGLLLSDGDKWHSRRKTLTPTFHFNILRHFNLVLAEKTKNLISQLESEVENPKTDIYPYITDFSLNSICETAMGTPLDEDASEIGKTYKNAIITLSKYIFHRIQKVWLYPNIIFNISSVGQDQKRLLHLISSFRNKVIERRKESYHQKTINTDPSNENDDDVFASKKKRKAMLDLLLEAEKEGRIDKEGIDEEVDTFIFEGFDTTSTALQYAFMLLANYKHVQDKIVEEYYEIVGSPDSKPTINELSQMKYLEAYIKESLRLYPPVHFINRKSDKSLQFKNFKCQAGTDYIVVIHELHQRCDQYDEPLEFRPERFLKEPTWHPFSYIPFSAGPRNCIGQKFAMLEMKQVVSAVLCEYRLLPVTKPTDIVFYMDMLLRSKDPIYVKFEKRNNKAV